MNLLATQLAPVQDASVGINILRQAEADQAGRNQDSLLREVGGVASSGNLLKAAEMALQGGDLKTGFDLQSLSIEKQQKLVETMQKGAERASTPEQWSAFIGSVERAFGPDQVGQFRDFNSRPDAISVLERSKLALERQKEAAPTADMRNAEYFSSLPEGDPRREFMTSKKEKPSEADKKIEALTSRGVSQADAEDVVYGISQVVTDPTLQTPMLVNKLTGEARPLMPGQNAAQAPAMAANGAAPAQGQPLPQPEAVQPEPLYDRADEATGLQRSAQSLWTDIAPQIPMVNREGYPEVVEAQQEFSVAVNELIRALSINPKYPVAEMERIRKEIDVGPSAFRSAETVQAKMRATDRALRSRLENERKASRDPNLPAEARRNALQAANDIENFLKRMGVPQVNLSIKDGQRARNPQTGEIIERRGGKWVPVQ